MTIQGYLFPTPPHPTPTPTPPRPEVMLLAWKERGLNETWSNLLHRRGSHSRKHRGMERKGMVQKVVLTLKLFRLVQNGSSKLHRKKPKKQGMEQEDHMSHTHAHTHTHTHMHTHTHIPTHTHTYTHMPTHTYLHTHTCFTSCTTAQCSCYKSAAVQHDRT